MELKFNKLKDKLRERRWRIARYALRLFLVFAGSCYIPFLWCSRNSGEWFSGDINLQRCLGNGVEEMIRQELERGCFSTGSKMFDGEWLFGSYMMAGMGFGQVAVQHPELKEKNVALMELCIENILSEKVKEFDIECWKEDPIATLEKGKGHVAYLGYLNLLMSFCRSLKPDMKFSDLNDRISAALKKRLETSRGMLVETYPGEVYPVDNCPAFASVVLHAKAVGIDCEAFKKTWLKNFKRFIDPKSGLMYQALDSYSGVPCDQPRGSGTFLGLYFLSFADMELSRKLYFAAKKNMFNTFFGFGVVREYPPGISGFGDIDSGPVIFGWGVSPTGFMIAGSRIHGDADVYSRLFATIYAWGAPVESGNKIKFVSGGSLGNAIMFAMLTAGGRCK